jgi:hypothetical protein
VVASSETNLETRALQSTLSGGPKSIKAKFVLYFLRVTGLAAGAAICGLQVRFSMRNIFVEMDMDFAV